MCISPSKIAESVGDFLGFDGEFGYQGTNEHTVTIEDAYWYDQYGVTPIGDPVSARQALHDYMNDWAAEHIDYGIPTDLVDASGVYWQFWADVATDWDMAQYNELATGAFSEFESSYYNPYNDGGSGSGGGGGDQPIEVQP